jgi:molybdate transport system permease protein
LSAGEWQALALSLKVSLSATLISLPFGILLAGWLALGKSRFRWLVDALVQIPLVLPPLVTGYILLMLFGRQGPLGGMLAAMGIEIAFDWKGAALAAAIVSFPLLVRAARAGFEATDPRLAEAARTLGAGPRDAFFTVIFPQARRSVLAGVLLAFTRGFGEFGATIVLASNIPGKTQTVPLAIFNQIQGAHGEGATLRLVIICVLVSLVAMIAARLLDGRPARKDSNA